MPAPITLKSPLLPADLLFSSMASTAGLSVLGEMQLNLLSPRSDLKPEDLLGKPLTVTASLRESGKRHFNGFVTRFGIGTRSGRYFGYQATVHPWLWFLTRTSDCRIFQELSVPDIVKKVFEDHGIASFSSKLFRTYRKWDYCVQYRESDYNFVARLLEHEGIYWYFEHSEDQHKLILVDSQSAHDASPECETLPFVEHGAETSPDSDCISEWTFSREVRSGKFALSSYDFERPSTSLLVDATQSRQYTMSDYEVFDYQGDYAQKADGSQLVGDRRDELQTAFQSLRGTSNAEGIEVGRLLKLSSHPRKDQNQQYLITGLSVNASVDNYESGDPTGHYQCAFAAIPVAQQFRPLRRTPKPFMQGPQTAMVTGPAGDEIFTDKFGRIKVQFHWDRYGKRDEHSSCWIRVSQPWAGKGWGGISVPRIGQEVVVDFLEGDPDQPLITGRVYNAEAMPPYGLPGGAVISGLKTQTHKGAGYNEMSMNDTAGKEKIIIHAQYDMDTTVEHDQTNTVNNTFTEKIKSDAKITITEGTYSHDVAANTATYHVKGALKENYDATQATTIKNDLTIVSTEGAISVTSTAQHVKVDAATSITLHVGASTISMNAAGEIKIEGTKITVNGTTIVTVKGGIVHSEADSEHQTKGAVVLSDGSATNTVKGGMVMLNP